MRVINYSNGSQERATKKTKTCTEGGKEQALRVKSVLDRRNKCEGPEAGLWHFLTLERKPAQLDYDEQVESMR